MKKNKNKDYWTKRAEERDKLAKKEEDEIIKEVAKLYEQAFLESYRDLYQFYLDYCDEDGVLTYQEAIKLLEPVDLKENAKKIKSLEKLYEATGDEKVKGYMKFLQARGKVTRQQALIDGIHVNFIEATAKSNEVMAQRLKKMYEREFKDTLEAVGVKGKSIPLKHIELAVTFAWSGLNFSSRIWKNKDKLVTFLEQELTKAMIKGVDPRKIARNGELRKLLRDQEKNVRWNCERLIRTESTHIRVQGTIDGYKKSKLINAVEIWTAGDDRVCGTCQDKGGTVIKLENAVSGDNCPPFHPACRCSIVPLIDYGGETDE